MLVVRADNAGRFRHRWCYRPAANDTAGLLVGVVDASTEARGKDARGVALATDFEARIARRLMVQVLERACQTSSLDC